MTSVFDSRTVHDIHDEIRKVYRGDRRPWILGYSGGKDSTCMVQLVWGALAELPPERLGKRIFIISSDTLVESPTVVQQITGTLESMESAAKKSHLPISTNLVRPTVEDTFWVCLLGKGFPAPSNLFRWCTERLKIRNADRFIQEKVSEYGEAVVVLGTRKDESTSRQQLMNMYEIKGSLLSRHSKFAQTYVYTPLRDFAEKDVWQYLLSRESPWGSSNRDLAAMYRNASASECPLVVDTSTPSCGNSRFGCWTCTVVDRDDSLSNTIDGGEEWMLPLLELREDLKDTQDPVRRREVRSLKRRTGQMKLIDDARREGFDKRIRESKKAGTGESDDPYAKLVPGPYTLEFCKEFLAKLLGAQNRVRQNGPDNNMSLIREEEIHEIQRIWRMERGDWRNSAYRIYEKATGVALSPPAEDMGAFGEAEQEMLEEVCARHGVPALLVSKLLNAEHEFSGMARHSRIHHKISKILAEEWRDDLGEIVADLEGKKKAMKEAGAK